MVLKVTIIRVLGEENLEAKITREGEDKPRISGHGDSLDNHLWKFSRVHERVPIFVT